MSFCAWCLRQSNSFIMGLQPTFLDYRSPISKEERCLKTISLCCLFEQYCSWRLNHSLSTRICSRVGRAGSAHCDLDMLFFNCGLGRLLNCSWIPVLQMFFCFFFFNSKRKRSYTLHLVQFCCKTRKSVIAQRLYIDKVATLLMMSR